MAAEDAMPRRMREALAVLPLQPPLISASVISASVISGSVISGSVISGTSATIVGIAAPQPSIRSDRPSPPCARGAAEPVASQSRRHCTATDGATPNRAAAPRQLTPPSITAITQSPRSSDKGRVVKAGLPLLPPP